MSIKAPLKGSIEELVLLWRGFAIAQNAIGNKQGAAAFNTCAEELERVLK